MNNPYAKKLISPFLRPHSRRKGGMPMNRVLSSGTNNGQVTHVPLPIEEESQTTTNE
jgi:hypothetical protein